MASLMNWFSSGASGDKRGEMVELEGQGDSARVGLEEQEQQLLPDMTEEEIERLKVEKAKRARRQQLDVILSSETALSTMLTSLKKSLREYETQKLELYAKRQKYRIVVANYKGPIDDQKLEAIKKILHIDLPELIDEMDDRIINGHAQLSSLERQLENLKQQRLKAERSYKKLFEPLIEGDLEGGRDDGSDDSSNGPYDTPIEVILAKYDPSHQLPRPPALDPYDTSSDDDEGGIRQKPANIPISLHAEPHALLADSRPPTSVLDASSSASMDEALIDVPLD